MVISFAGVNYSEAPWSSETLLVPRGDVARRGFPLGSSLGAFKNDDIAWHTDVLSVESLGLKFVSKSRGCPRQAGRYVSGFLIIFKRFFLLLELVIETSLIIQQLTYMLILHCHNL